jgi:hypothetical protein
MHYRLSMSKIGRRQRRSAAGAAAYRAGERLVDPRTGAVYDYSRRRGVASTALLVPGAPVGAVSRQDLWGAVERHHRRGDAVTAREIVVSIPWDLEPRDRQQLVLRYAAELTERYGVAADVAIHLPSRRPGRDPRNHHAHILLSACSVHYDDGVLRLGKKVEALDPISCQRSGRAPVCEAERARWAELCRQARAAAGLPEAPIDHRSYLRRGLDAIPQVHLGPEAADNLSRHLAGERVLLLDRTRQWLQREEARAALREAQRLEAEIAAEEAAELAGAAEDEQSGAVEASAMAPAPMPRPRLRAPAAADAPEPEDEPAEEPARPTAEVVWLYPPVQSPPERPLRSRAELAELLARAARLLAEQEKRREQHRRAMAAWQAARRELQLAAKALADARARWWSRAAAVVGRGPLAAAERRLAAAEAALGPARMEAEQAQIALGLAQRRLDALDILALERELAEVLERERELEWLRAPPDPPDHDPASQPPDEPPDEPPDDQPPDEPVPVPGM